MKNSSNPPAPTCSHLLPEHMGEDRRNDLLPPAPNPPLQGVGAEQVEAPSPHHPDHVTTDATREQVMSFITRQARGAR